MVDAENIADRARTMLREQGCGEAGELISDVLDAVIRGDDAMASALILKLDNQV